jgi:hypothetical protein
MMKSSLDTHVYSDFKSSSVLETPEKPSIKLNCRHAMATKIRDLSSDIMGLGGSL